MNYLIQLSNKTEIEIDEADFKKLTENSSSGNLIRLKRGIVNPSFIVSIIPSSVEKKRKIKGHIDSLTGNYVIDEETYEPFVLSDEMSDVKRLK